MNKSITCTRTKISSGLKTGMIFAFFLLSIGQSNAANRIWTGTANSDFNNLLNWSTFAVPGVGDTATITLTNTATITLSADVTISRLNFTISGNSKTGILDVGSHTLIITGTTNIDVTSGNSNTLLEVGVNGGTSAGTVDFGGAVAASVAAAGKAGFIGNPNSTLIFRGDLSFGLRGYVDPTDIPGTALFDASGSQTVTYNNAGSADANFGNVIIGSTNNPIVTLAGLATAANRNISGNLTINGSSTLDFATFVWNRLTAGGTLALNNTATMKLAANTGGQAGSNFPSNFTTMTLAAGSTVEYNSAGGVAQTIYAVPTYGNLTLSQGTGTGGTIKTAGAALTVAGNFLINPNATFTASTFIHNMKGNWTNNGTFTQGTSTIILSGTSNQSVGGSSANIFNNLTVNNAAGVTLTADATVNATATLTSGIVTTNAFKLIIATGGTVARTSGYVNGFLQKNVATGAPSRTFEVGGSSVYSPVTVVFTGVTTAGNLIAKATDGDHPDIVNSGIDASKSVNRYWTLTNSGIVFASYSATFTFVAGDIDGGASTASFIVRKRNGTWATTTIGTRTGTTTQATGMTSLSDFQIGEISTLAVTCPSNFTVGNDAGLCQATVSYTGSHAATSTSTPPPTITYAPAGPFAVGSTTTVTATAVNLNGSVNCTFNVTVADNEAPVISSCPSNINICSFVATWSSPSANDNCGMLSFTSDHNSGDVFPPGTTTVTYTATDIHSNTSTCQFTVTTTAPPTADAKGDVNGCHSGTFTLAGAIAGGATSSTWTTLGDGTFNDATLLAAVYTPGPNDSIAGSATLVLTTNDPAGPCNAATDSMTITFAYAPPKPDAVTGPGPLTACNTDVFSYTTSAATATSYNWNSFLPASASITGGQGTNTAQITFGALPQFTSYYPFSVTAHNACGTSVARTFSIQNVVSVPIFTPGLPTLVCPGTSGVVYSVTAGAGVSTYNWTVPTGANIVAGAGTNSITVDFGSSYTAGYVAVSASNACMTSAERRIFVDFKPAQPAVISGNATPCPGTSAYSVTAVTGAVTYTWTLPTGVTIQSGAGTNAITALFSNTWQSGNITVTAASGCTPATNSVTRVKNLTSPLPQIPASVTGPSTNLCGQTVTYTSSSVSGTSSYQWTVPAGSTINSGQGTTSISVTYPSSGLTGANVCVSAVTNSCSAPNNTRGSRCLPVSTVPLHPGTITGPATVCPATTYTYSVTNVAGLTYAWDVPSSATITSGTGTNSIQVLWGNADGIVNVTAFNSCGGSNTSSKLTTFGTCRIANQELSSTETGNGLKAYPNPAGDHLTLEINRNTETGYHLEISDLAGRIIQLEDGNLSEGINQIELDMSSFKAGIYIATLKDGDSKHQVRIVKQ